MSPTCNHAILQVYYALIFTTDIRSCDNHKEHTGYSKCSKLLELLLATFHLLNLEYIESHSLTQRSALTHHCQVP